MQRKAIQIDAITNDLKVEGGELAIGTTDDQNAQLIVIAEKGEFKEYPQLGVGAIKYIHTIGTDKMLKREIAVQLSLDGYNNPAVTFTDNKICIEV